MRYIFTSLLFLIANTMVVFEFTSDSDLSNWNIVEDVVMGGRSNGNFFLNNSGNGVFNGAVSLENNGGFSSVRYSLSSLNIKAYTTAVLILRGDGKLYQFRVKSNTSQRHSYITSFDTSGEWQTIEILLSDLYPAFRGSKLNIGNFQEETFSQLAFLIGNKKEEAFELEIKSISLK